MLPREMPCGWHKNQWPLSPVIEPAVSSATDDLDKADTTNINALIRLASQYIDSGEGKEKLNGLVEKLANPGE